MMPFAREGRTSWGRLQAFPAIKECFAVEEMPHTAGVVARMGEVAGEDADAVRILREAGFVILGVSNTSELCIWMESVNKVYGRTANPYDFSRTAGGVRVEKEPWWALAGLLLAWGPT